MIEIDRWRSPELKTSEYAKEWTEKSPNSKLNIVKRIFNNRRLDNIPEAKKMKDKLQNRDYRELQRLAWMKLKDCDWKLWKNSLAHIGNYINKLKSLHRITSSTDWELWHLSWDMIWQIQNQTDTLQIQHNEQMYLQHHETMSDAEYRQLFAWRERLQQGQLWDCYLVSWINELARAQHFDTLMRTSIQRMRWNDGSLGYQIKIPLGEPSGRKILLKDSEVWVAKIRWNKWYKLLELAYAKNKLRKNDRNWNRYAPITASELQKIEWWWTHEVLTTFLGKQNIWFNDFWTMKNYQAWKLLSTSSQNAKTEITNFLKHYDPRIWNKFVSLATLKWSSDRKSYTVWRNTLYHKHAYSLWGVQKDTTWNILNIRVHNPWNQKWAWKNYQDFTLNEFLNSFSAMSCWKIKTSNFLDQKALTA